MAKIINEHQCDSCDETSYFVRLAEPQAVRVEDPKKPFAALAEYAIVTIGTYRASDDAPVVELTTAMVADENEKSYPGALYAYNRKRTLEEVMWTLGGEYKNEVEVGNGTA